MKILTYTALILAGILMSNSAQAVDLIFRDDKGFFHFRCEALGGGGVARVKQVGKDKYLVFGGNYSGVVVPARSAAHAGRVACGESR